MKKQLLVLLTTLLALNISAQKYLKITNGYSSVQIKVSSDQVSKLYYVIYKTLPTVDPTPLELKTSVGTNVITNIERKGTISINNALIGDTITQSIINIPVVSSAIPKILYIYTVYDDGSLLGSVVKQTLTFERKQFRKVFKSNAIKAGSLLDVPYALYLPESYYHNPGKKYPTIVFFHGDYQKGVVNQKYVGIESLFTDALPNYLEGSLNLDFIVISPQVHGWDYNWENTAFVNQLIEQVKTEYNVDDHKIYGIGCSGGGGGLYNFASNYSSVFSGMSPMSGVLSLKVQQEYCNTKDIPFWGFHSDGDNGVNLNNLNVYINSVNLCGPLLPPRKTVYKGNIHDCWKYPLRQDSIYRFFLARDLTNKTNKVEPIAFDTNLTVSRNSAGVAEINFPSLVDNPQYEYFWYQRSGNDVVLKDQYTRTPSLVNPNIGGTYKFRLIMKKPNGNTNYRDVVVTISTITSVEDVHLDQVFDKWEIYDLEGRKIRESIKSKPELAGLAQGIYVVRTGEGSFKICVK